MELIIDKNKLLCLGAIENTTKEFKHTIEWSFFVDYDKLIPIEHKKQRKTLQFKELSDKMAVCYVSSRTQNIADWLWNLETAGAIAALGLFRWLDESNNKRYAFLYKYPTNNINILNHQLSMLGLGASTHKTEKWVIVQLPEKAQGSIGFDDANVNTTISFLFMLTLLYGKFDIREWALHNIKIHIPLFGAYLKDQKIFDTITFALQEKGIFLEKNIIQSNDGIIYQISSSDYELLQSMAKYYKPIAKISKIPSFDRAVQSKELLLQFLANMAPKPANYDAVSEQMRTHIVKFIQK